MNKTKLKERLIQEIQNIENEAVLNEVYRLLELESEDLKPYQLSSVQIDAINDARQQMNIGKFLTHEEAQKKINKWLSK